MKIAGYILLLLLFFSCTRKYAITGEFRHGIPEGFSGIVLDSSYELYIREVYKDVSVPGDFKVKERVTTVNPETDKLIEIEYLLVSFKKGNAFYISTIPDKYQNYYSKKIKYFKTEELNAYDFSTFSFGKINSAGNAVKFDNEVTKHSDTWRFNLLGDSLHVYQAEERIKNDPVNIYLVDEALSKPALFIRKPNFKIAFRNMEKEKREETRKGRPPYLRFSIDSTVYYQTANKKTSIYFRFNRNITGFRDSTIKFSFDRMHNHPSVLDRR
jgi:hypothetical protein